jgi:hypothetical protein
MQTPRRWVPQMCRTLYVLVGLSDWIPFLTGDLGRSTSPSSSTPPSSVISQVLIDLFRPRLLLSPKVFQDVFVHLVYNSVLFLASCYCSFLLHVAANLICIFLISRQMVLLSTLPEFLHSFCGRKNNYVLGCSENLFSADANRFLIHFSKGPNLASMYKKGGSQCIRYLYS